jgi:hypothetical protein
LVLELPIIYPTHGCVGGSMEVKNDVSKIAEPNVTGISIKVTNTAKDTVSSKEIADLEEVPVDDVKLTNYATQRSKTTEISKANEAISSLSKVADDVKKLSELTNSVAGIVDLAQSSDTTDSQKQTLKGEVKQLSGVITNIATELRQAKVITVPEEAARIELEKNLAEALDVFLPDPPRGPADINISTKQAIIQTRNLISKAQAQIARLRESLKSELEQTVEYVKSQRKKDSSEGPQKNISEADQAFKTSITLREDITASPVVAKLAVTGPEIGSSNVLFR